MTKGLLFLLGVVLSTDLMAQTAPYLDPQLSPEVRAQDLISRLSLSEKAALMCDVSEAIPRLGIKKFNWWSEALARPGHTLTVSRCSLSRSAWLLRLTMPWCTESSMPSRTKSGPSTTRRKREAARIVVS